MRAVVLAGGVGSRLRPLTAHTPKPLMLLDGMPILEVILRQLRHAGFTRITLLLGYHAEMIRRRYGDGAELGLTLDYHVESEPLGTAGPLRYVLPLHETALVMNADLLTDLNFQELYLRHQESGAAATVALCRHNLDVAYGVVQLDAQDAVVGFMEKPRYIFDVNCGIYVIEPKVLELLPAAGTYAMPALLEKVRDAGGLVVGYRFAGAWIDIGTADQLARAKAAFSQGRSRFLRCDPELATAGAASSRKLASEAV